MPGKKRGTKKSAEHVQDTTEQPAGSVTSREAGSGFAGQVVEVVDEETPRVEREPEAAPTETSGDAGEEPPSEPASDGEVEEEMPQEEEKRKEMVDDLFEEQSSAVMPEISIHKKSAVIPFVSWVLVVLTVAAVTGGALYILIQRPTLKLPVLFAKPTPTPTPSPTPTPVAAKREDVSIQVLNGGGTAGAAGKMKKLLEDKGYSVKDVGNTDEYTYTKTEILVKAGKEAYRTLLESDLKDTYSLGTASATLPADVTYDVRVIVGKE